jgi:hypothetical protein
MLCQLHKLAVMKGETEHVGMSEVFHGLTEFLQTNSVIESRLGHDHCLQNFNLSFVSDRMVGANIGWDAAKM